MFIRGIILSASARAFKKKDGSGMNVKITHEIAVQPGVVLWDEFHDPAQSQDIVVRGEEVISFPRYPDFQQIALKFKRYREFNNTLTVSDAEVLGQ